MSKARLGEQESAVLKWIAEHAPATVAEVTEGFASPRALARTTLLTVMERLRAKGYLTREKTHGVFRYAPSEPHPHQMRGVVRRFVESSLGGSLDPFVAYLAEDAHLSAAQLERLKQLVRDLEAAGNNADNNVQPPANAVREDVP